MAIDRSAVGIVHAPCNRIGSNIDTHALRHPLKGDHIDPHPGRGVRDETVQAEEPAYRIKSLRNKTIVFSEGG